MYVSSVLSRFCTKISRIIQTMQSVGVIAETVFFVSLINGNKITQNVLSTHLITKMAVPVQCQSIEGPTYFYIHIIT